MRTQRKASEVEIIGGVRRNGLIRQSGRDVPPPAQRDFIIPVSCIGAEPNALFQVCIELVESYIGPSGGIVAPKDLSARIGARVVFL